MSGWVGSGDWNVVRVWTAELGELVEYVERQGGATATEAARELPVTREALVKHPAVLGQAGLVRGERRGREVRYTVEPATLEATASWLSSLAAAWDARLAVIKRIAEEAE